MGGKYANYWEMTEGGPYDKGKHKIFKCTGCGAESEAGKDWNGEPDPNRCAKHCRSRETDWSPGNVSGNYKRNFEKIFPESPGAGI